MVIAVTYNKENGQIGEHFGHADFFKLYEVEDGRIYDSAVVAPVGKGHSAMVEFLDDYMVDVVICRNIGEGALAGLQDASIAVCANVEGAADDAIEAFMTGQLQVTTAASCGCDHHAAGGHSCCGSGHGEGGHGCCGSSEGCGAPGSCCQ